MLKSLHVRLLAGLIVALLFLSAAHLFITYLDTKKTSEEIFDKLMVMLALSISEYALATGGDLPTDDLLELIRVTTNDNLYYKVVGPDAAFIMGYEDIPEPSGGIQVLDGNVQFYDSQYLGQPVRVIAVSTLVDDREFSGWMTSFVAQTLRDRAAYTNKILIGNVQRIVVLIGVTSLVLWAAIGLGLKPLRRLQQSVTRRDMNDLSAIRHEHLPEEIQGLVGALNDLLQRLSAQIALTKRFVENAAHELRTPVSALLPQSELALRHAESERERKAVGKIKQSAEKIARLTHQLLNLTYAESISLSTRDYPTIDLADVAHRHIESFEELHQDVNIKSELQTVSIRGQDVLIGEVLDNLLDNAYKYGANPITVSTYRNEQSAVLCVADSGVGIDADIKERVTERFFRGNKNSTGSGLGLAIVKEIVEAHGGHLSIEEIENGHGTLVRCAFRPIP